MLFRDTQSHITSQGIQDSSRTGWAVGKQILKDSGGNATPDTLKCYVTEYQPNVTNG